MFIQVSTHNIFIIIASVSVQCSNGDIFHNYHNYWSLIAHYPGQPLGIYDGQDEFESSKDDSVVDAEPREITELQQLSGLSKEKIKHIYRSIQRQEYKTNSYDKIVSEDSTVSIFAIIKVIMFTSLLSGLVYVLNRDYNNVATIWFVQTFPRESSSLGLSGDELWVYMLYYLPMVIHLWTTDCLSLVTYLPERT